MGRIFLFFAFGIISSAARAAGPMQACLPCPAGIDCPAGTDESDIAEEMAAQDTSLGVPVGFVMPSAIYRGAEFGGWLLCDGQDIPAGAKYDALRNLLGSTYGEGKVPNFQGMFLRGQGSQALASGKDGADTVHASGDIGEWQGDAIRNITGQFNLIRTNSSQYGATHPFSASGDSRKDDSNGSGGMASFASTLSMDLSKSVPAASENRPVNYAVYYYIKR